MKIEPGAVVVLRSGGPHMTVEEMGEHVDAKCVWFTRDELRNEWLPLATLKLAPVVDTSRGVAPGVKGIV